MLAMAQITTEPLDATAAMAGVSHEGAGAVLSFVGVVRDNARGRRVVGIEYHAYASMALRQLEKIEEATRGRWPAVRIEIRHRTGALRVGEPSVVIAVSSSHRAEGFDALRAAIETLKRDAPIWKKEIYDDGFAWIEGS